jgi:outer membrane protein TolC
MPDLPTRSRQVLSLAEAKEITLRSNKSIAVLGHAPQVTATTIGVEEAAFNPVFGVRGLGGTYNRQTANVFESLGTNSGTTRQSFVRSPDLNNFSITKLLSSGGKLEYGYGGNYFKVAPVDPTVQFLNPYWRSALNVALDQPLFRGRGPAVARAPIAIARATHQQSFQLFQAAVNTLMRDVELAYWDAVQANREVVTREASMNQAAQTLAMERDRLRLGEGTVPDVALAEEQFEFLSIARSQAMSRAAIAERNLRRIMGLPPGSDQQFIAAADPVTDAPNVDWPSAVITAMTRPEFSSQRAAIRAAENDLMVARNGLLPDLSARAIYSATGLDSTLGPSIGTAFGNQFNDWTVGVFYRYSIGQQAENALLRRAQLAVSRERARLDELEHETIHEMYNASQALTAAYDLLQMHRRRREAAAQQLEARKELYRQRRSDTNTQLMAEARYNAAMLDESIAVVEYQKALARWRYASGTLLENSIVLADPERVTPPAREAVTPPPAALPGVNSLPPTPPAPRVGPGR